RPVRLVLSSQGTGDAARPADYYAGKDVPHVGRFPIRPRKAGLEMGATRLAALRVFMLPPPARVSHFLLLFCGVGGVYPPPMFQAVAWVSCCESVLLLPSPTP